MILRAQYAQVNVVNKHYIKINAAPAALKLTQMQRGGIIWRALVQRVIRSTYYNSRRLGIVFMASERALAPSAPMELNWILHVSGRREEDTNRHASSLTNTQLATKWTTLLYLGQPTLISEGQPLSSWCLREPWLLQHQQSCCRCCERGRHNCNHHDTSSLTNTQLAY